LYKKDVSDVGELDTFYEVTGVPTEYISEIQICGKEYTIWLLDETTESFYEKTYYSGIEIRFSFDDRDEVDDECWKIMQIYLILLRLNDDIVHVYLEGTVGGFNPYYVAEVTTSGDVDLDGTLGLTDVIVLQKYLVNSMALNSEALANADVDESGELSKNDALILMQFLIGKITTLPYTA